MASQSVSPVPRILVVAAVLALIGVGYVAIGTKGRQPVNVEVTMAAPNKSISTERKVESAKVSIGEEPRLPATAENMVLPHEDTVQEIVHAAPGMDPEKQPRKMHINDFRGLKSLPAGFTVEGLVMTEAGFQLPPASDPNNPYREGVLTSPDEPTDFPSNSFAPLWLDKLPDGTNVNVEIAFSPDGKDWGQWTPVIRSDEAEFEPTFPDGTPNPNYGYAAGPMYNWGEEQWDHFRYRVTLSSGVEASPTLEVLRVFYQDSTMGTGSRGDVAALDAIVPNPAN